MLWNKTKPMPNMRPNKLTMDTTPYINTTKYINVKSVEALPADQRFFTIVGEGEPKTFKNKDGKDELKPTIPVMSNSSALEYQWTLSYKAIMDLSRELGTNETKDWVGKRIKLLLVPNKQGSQTVTATAI